MSVQPAGMTVNSERVENHLPELEARVRGRVIRPHDPEYDAARKV